MRVAQDLPPNRHELRYRAVETGNSQEKAVLV
ncbi:Uncharacterised protein [Vibrio cholerae]|uniref:Uncharacterized protein n=1 Tax=Vibrio cholerae TaxID=666 RepID=A0A655PC57_VIBCL|nr:Uncharacterised protein [Vibrio cholerae]CSA36589.1 Uncharacterised protein [Vibrio cholerae]CSC64142.1 Uncharacterised protein [Vibrio cholerae]